MTRWKREWQRWVEREGLWAYMTPRKPEDWARAQMASRFIDYQFRKPEVQQAIHDHVVDSLLNGGSTSDVGLGSLIP